MSLGLLLPLVLTLLVLSACPALVSDARRHDAVHGVRRRGSAAVIDTPNGVDWLALAPTLSLLGASGVALLAAVLVPEWMRRGVAAGVALLGCVLATVFACVVFSETPVAEPLLSDSMVRDRLAAFAQVILAVTTAAVVLVAGPSAGTTPASTTRC